MRVIVTLLAMVTVGLVLIACGEEESLTDLQTTHCSAAAYWFGRPDGTVTVTATRAWTRTGKRVIVVTYTLKSRPESGFKGATISNLFKCTYRMDGTRKETLRAIEMEISGRKLSPETRDAMNIRIGLLGQGGSAD